MPPFSLQSWSLPRGVSRSLWEYAHDPEIARGDAQHLAGSVLTELDARLLERWLPDVADVVDLGCGPGRIAIPLARRGFRVLAVDLSPESLAEVERQARAERLPLAAVRANLCELDCLPEGQFGVALLMFGTLGMIEGPENRRAAVDHAVRLLKPGGRLILHAHNVWRQFFLPATRGWFLRDRWKAFRGDPTAGDSRRDYRGIPGMYHHAFSWTELQRLLCDAGLEIVEAVPLNPEGSQSTSRTWWTYHVASLGWIVQARKR